MRQFTWLLNVSQRRTEILEAGLCRSSLDICKRHTLLQRGHAGIAPLKELLVFTLNNSGVQWEAWTKNFKVKFKPHARDELTYILASIPKQKWINPGNGKLHQMNSNPAEFATTEPREAGSDMWALSAHSGSTYLVSPAETLPILG